MTQRWKHRPEGSTWGDFGPDDQLGRLNLLTAEKVLQGIAEVKEGRSFCLSLPLDYPGGNKLNPRRHPPRRFATIRPAGPNFNYELRRDHADHTDVVCDDAVLLHMQYSTQWDALSHVGSLFDADGDGEPEVVYYNGFRGGEDIVYEPGHAHDDSCGPFEGSDARALGIENMAIKAIQGRGVMVDLEAHFGRDRRLVGYDDLMRVIEQDKVIIESGDMVCLHTGFAAVLLEMNKNPDQHRLETSCAVLDGRDQRLLQWITDSGLAALIADNYAVEAHPSRPGSGKHAFMPLHEHCLFKLGVNLGEIWWLTELAGWLRTYGRSRFLLTAPPLRMPGCVGSPTTPVATV